ncbi:hypothetical protein EC991_011427 [Linnemannia zychae]|nr:hypothetical protein EC991_011427 [Linnemannia zychae]
MEKTQSFHLAGREDISKISVSNVGRQNAFYWDDVRGVFSRVKCVQNGNVAVNKMKDLGGISYASPHQALPGSGLGCNWTSAANHVHDESLMTNPSTTFAATLSESVSSLAIAEEPFPDHAYAEPRQTTIIRGSIVHIQNQVDFIMMTIKQEQQSGKSLSSEAISSLITSKLSPLLTAKSRFERAVIHKLRGSFQILRAARECERPSDFIQSKTEAILTQQLELTENPTPRLFIVLPEDQITYDPENWIRTKFRLHFICECGKHTESNNSKIQHHLHLTNHEGYLIREPTEFFKKYGPFLLLMLELMKFGTSIAGHGAPALASFKVAELADSVKQSVKSVTAKIDYSLECIDNQLAKVQASPLGDFGTDPQGAMTQQDLVNYLSDVESLEGIELRQLGSLLETSEQENILGNLYRMITSEGHVKWVCLDHYRVSYQEKNTWRLRNVVQLARGDFDEQLGRIEIVLTSMDAAFLFNSALGRVNGVLELDVAFNWECERSDLEELEKALKKSRVSILRLDLRNVRKTPTTKVITWPTLSRVLFLMLRDVTRTKHNKRIQNSGSDVHDKLGSHLVLYHKAVGSNGAQALSEALKANLTRISLDLRYNSIGDNRAQALSEALITNVPGRNIIWK